MENVSDPLEYCPDVVISKLRAEIALKDQQIEFLRKKLNDVLNAANITGEKDVAPPLLCLMADRFMEFMGRGDPTVDGRFKAPDRFWYAEFDILWRGGAEWLREKAALDVHPLIWMSNLQTEERVRIRPRLNNFWEISPDIYHSIKHQYSPP